MTDVYPEHVLIHPHISLYGSEGNIQQTNGLRSFLLVQNANGKVLPQLHTSHILRIQGHALSELPGTVT